MEDFFPSLTHARTHARRVNVLFFPQSFICPRQTRRRVTKHPPPASPTPPPKAVPASVFNCRSGVIPLPLVSTDDGCEVRFGSRHAIVLQRLTLLVIKPPAAATAGALAQGSCSNANLVTMVHPDARSALTCRSRLIGRRFPIIVISSLLRCVG